MKHLQSAIQSVVLLVGFSAFAGSATVTDLSFRQRWPWSEKVDVDYVLAATDTCDVAVFASYEGSGGPVEIPAAAIVGDRINSVRPGRHHLEIDPVAAGWTLPLKGLSVSVTPYDAASRTYLVIDLESGAYEYLADVPEGGWTAEHKTTKMVFRRVPAGGIREGADYLSQLWGFYAGDPLEKFCHYRNVQITSDFYLAIFKLTCDQFIKLHSGAQDSGKAPYVWATYNMVRGAAPTYNWPNTRFAVDPASLAGTIRSRTGNRFLVDLPTEGQWEYAARAGSLADSANETIMVREGATLGVASGKPFANMDVISNRLSEVAWCIVNTNAQGSARHEVGLLKPNAWGLYDTIGNYTEMTLDVFPANDLGYRTDSVDPVGVSAPEDGSSRVLCGAHPGDTFLAKLMFAWRQSASQTLEGYGVRLAIHLNPPSSFEN